ncbi:unnamed protein product [Protopolystoma xenopodis]|uniref:Uncharacterized protein n=1 Tax=Protopolystoma xenopodis TaxID=117903 RepID=A0A3S5B8Y6_9PLAT|nr:unnamed protein product [Protopolystoma xenopodis]
MSRSYVSTEFQIALPPKGILIHAGVDCSFYLAQTGLISNHNGISTRSTPIWRRQSFANLICASRNRGQPEDSSGSRPSNWLLLRRFNCASLSLLLVIHFSSKITPAIVVRQVEAFCASV